MTPRNDQPRPSPSTFVAGGGWEPQIVQKKKKTRFFLNLSVAWLLVDLLVMLYLLLFSIQNPNLNFKTFTVWRWTLLIGAMAPHPFFVIAAIYFALTEKEITTTTLIRQSDYASKKLY